MSKKSIHVAIALIRHKNQILIGWRDEQLHQGGCYEFPGGKVEKNENACDAVKREVLEEVGVNIEVGHLFAQKHFDYGDKEIFLEFFLCQVLTEDLAKITSPWQWVQLKELNQFTFPAANQSIVAQLVWSKTLAITAEDTDLSLNLPQHPLCYLRKPYQSIAEIQHDVDVLVAQDVKVILNLQYFEQLDVEDQQKIFAIHVNSTQLQQFDIRVRYPQQQFIAACHTDQDILRANQQFCNAIFISPVQPTATHPEQTALGWQKLAEWTAVADMPVFALGGLTLADLEIAQQHGAYGIAGIRNFF